MTPDATILPVFVSALARSEATQPFWAGLAAGELRLPRCIDCNRLFFYPRRCCPYCWSQNLTWERSSGRGRVYAATVVHVPFDPDVQVPMSVALVDLDEGVRVACRFEPAGTQPAVGDLVELVFPDEPAETLPAFRVSPQHIPSEARR
jgi:uncharacterized OB-fold protein